MKLVIAEDDQFCLRFIRESLTPMCRSVEGVETLHDLLLLLDESVDFIWLDLALKDSSTHQTISAIPEMKRRSPKASLMVVTGWGEAHKTSALEAGADYYADKKELKGFKRPVLARLLQKAAMEYIGRGGDGTRVLQAVSSFMQNTEHDV